MRKIAVTFVLLLILFSLTPPELRAEEGYDIKNYFPLDAGNSWQYDGTREIITKDGMTKDKINTRIASIKGKEMLNGKEVFILEENANLGPWFYISSSPQGILLYKIKFKDRYLDYYYLIDDAGITFYPGSLRRAGKLTYRAPVKRYDLNDKLIDEGTIEITFKLRKPKDINIGAGMFEDCIEVYRLISFKTEKAFMSVMEENWLAPNIGKICGQHWIKIKEANRGNLDLSFGVKFELKSALIKGNLIGSSKVTN